MPALQARRVRARMSRLVTLEDVRALRSVLAGASDEGLSGFLSGHALGHVAGLIVASMTPATRRGFFTAMLLEYPTEIVDLAPLPKTGSDIQ